MDWFVIGDRADRDTPITWSRRSSPRPAPAGVAATDRSVADVRAGAEDVRSGRREIATGRRTLLTAGAAGLRLLDRRRRAGAAAGGRRTREARLRAGHRRLPARRDRQRADARTCAALRDGGLRFPRAVVDAGDGDHPQPRDDDDRRCGPDRTGVPANSIYDRALGDGPRPWTGRRDIRSDTVIERLNRARLHDRHGAQQGVPVRRLRRPGHAPLGAGADRPGHRATRPTCSRWRPRWRCSTSSTRT